MSTVLTLSRAPGLARRADHLLAAWYVGWFAAYSVAGGASWHFFVVGGRALSDLDDAVRGGIHLYAAYPEIQIGPLALLLAHLLSVFGPAGSLFVAQLLGALAGVTVLLLARSIAGEVRPDLSVAQVDQRSRLAAVFAAPVWLYLAVSSTHIEDVLAILFATAAVWTALRRQDVLSGLLVGLAVDCKPWAVPFAAVLFMIPGWDRRLRGAAVLAATVAAAWLPFLVLDPHTMNAIRFTIANTPRSALRLLGVTSARTPSWDRPLQSALGLLLATLAIRRGRWAAIVMVGVATRMVLDPGTNIYYSGGLVAGAALWDIAGSRSSFPWWTAAAAITLYGARRVPLPLSSNGWFLIIFFIAVLVLIVRGRSSTPSRAPASG